MTQTVIYHTDAPRIHRTFAELLAEFKMLKSKGALLKLMRETFLKDELLAIALWYAEKCADLQGEKTTDIFADFEEVSHE